MIRLENILQNYLARKEIFKASSTTVLNPETVEFEEVTAADLQWMSMVSDTFIAEIGQIDFSLSNIAAKLNISERHFGRRIKQITGMPPSAYLKEIQLQKDWQLLEAKAYASVKEVSLAIGITTSKYFSSIYKKRFGKLPSEYL